MGELGVKCDIAWMNNIRWISIVAKYMALMGELVASIVRRNSIINYPSLCLTLLI